MDHRIIRCFEQKNKKITGLPCSRLANPKTVSRRLFFCFFAFLFSHLQSSCTMILIIGLVASHLREEGVCMHKTGWGAEWIFGIYYFLLTRFFSPPSPDLAHWSGSPRDFFAWPRQCVVSPWVSRLSAQTLGSRGTFSFLHRIGMERLGGRAWDIHLFSTSESTTAH